MTNAAGSLKSLVGLASILSILLLVTSSAQTADNAAAPDRREEKLKSHTPPDFPPPPANSAPQSELLSFSGGKAKEYAFPHIDVLTYHYDNKRTGINQTERDLTPSKVASSDFSLLKTLQVEGNVFAQPLLISNFVMPDGEAHDVLIIATGHNIIYAFDTKTFSILWKIDDLGPAQKSADVGCGDVETEYGITSTPVIVRQSDNSAILYVVSATEPSYMEFHTYIHAIDLRTHAKITSAEIFPTDSPHEKPSIKFNPQNQWSRAGLVYNNKSIFVSIGSHCDGVTDGVVLSGWLLKYSDNLTLKGSFHTISAPRTGLASIWMTGFAPAIDELGNIIVVTGNGDVNPPDNYGNSVIKINSETMMVSDYFIPSNYIRLNQGDFDFGSGGVVLFSTSTQGSKKDLAVVIGKDPVLYTLDLADLGKNQANDAGVVQALRVKPCAVAKPCRGVWGGPALFPTEDGLHLYLQAEGDVLRSFLLKNATTPMFEASAVHGGTAGGYGGSIPIVSSNASDDGVVWLLRRSMPIELEAYDAKSLALLTSALVGDWSKDPSPADKMVNAFLTPLVANGRVYAPAFNVVKVFGLASEGMSPMSRAFQPLR